MAKDKSDRPIPIALNKVISASAGRAMSSLISYEIVRIFFHPGSSLPSKWAMNSADMCWIVPRLSTATMSARSKILSVNSILAGTIAPIALRWEPFAIKSAFKNGTVEFVTIVTIGMSFVVSSRVSQEITSKSNSDRTAFAKRLRFSGLRLNTCNFFSGRTAWHAATCGNACFPRQSLRQCASDRAQLLQ